MPYQSIGGGGGSTTFDKVSSGTNTTAALVVGSGASLATTGSGTISATSVPFSGISTATNTTATMTVGAGGSVTFTSTGVVNANQLGGTSIGTPTGTGNVVFSASPTLTGTLTCAAIAASGQIATTVAVAASVSPLYVNNTTWTVAAGTGTTTFPQVYINGGNAPSGWSTSGTGLGINVPSGGTANAIDVHANGGGSLFSVNGSGAITTAGKINTSYAGAASQSAITTTAAPAATGTGTTNFPMWFANGAGATAATNWSTSGTIFGANIHTAIGNMMDLKIDGVSQWAVSGTGSLTCAGSLTTGTPTGGTSGAWKLGVIVAATTALDTTRYLQVDVGGTLVHLAIGT